MKLASIFRLVAIVVPAASAIAACGGPGAHGGQSNLVEKTFAGANKCSAKNHDRPFIIEWDATDQSSFQAQTADNIVVVKYEGCDLKVLDACKNDAVKGAIGAYKTIDWTAGQLESMEISDEQELYAKLPLGAATLGGRVTSGEQFRMEYYVSGTRAATREKVYRKDLDKISGCQGATHFVYNYNLGAFALASKKSLHGEVNGSYLGFGAGGSSKTDTKADKKGGDLSKCQGDSAREVDQCKVPIRLTLRAISDGDNPDTVAAQAPETDDAKNLAGRLQATSDREKKAAEYLDSASKKLQAGDGKGCLADLDQHDKLDPRPGGMSTNPAASWPAMLRGQCLMLSGQCEAGKATFRKAYEAGPGAGSDPDKIDTIVGVYSGKFCQGGKLTPRDEMIKARMTLQEGAWTKKTDVATCTNAYKTILRLKDTVKPKDDDDVLLKDPVQFAMTSAPACILKAGGDCEAAFQAYWELAKINYKGQKSEDWFSKEANARNGFSHPKCPKNK
jgi:hypothetical protein